MALTNENRIKSSTEDQVYKVVTTHAHEISGCKIISILLHAQEPHLGVMDCDIHYELSTLELKQEEKLENFHIRILRLQQ